MDTQTRHALKQDRFIQASQTGLEWFQEHRGRVIALGSAGVILAALIITSLVVYNQRSAAADLALGQAIETYSAPLAQPGQSASPGEMVFATAAERAKSANRQFVEIADRYGMLRAGKDAKYFAGLTAMDLGLKGAAEADLKEVAGSYDSALASLAKLALANFYQQTNRTSEAVALYQQLIAKPTSTVPASAAQLQLAALYETTNPAEARRIYAQLKNDKTAAGQIAAQKLEQK